MAIENRSLGRFCLEDISPAARGVPRIEVTFSIDADGIVQARARDADTGRERGITVAADGGLSGEEIERLKAEAEQFSGLDSGRRREILARREADAALHLCERALNLRGEELAAPVVAKIESKTSALRVALRGRSVARIQAATRSLKAALAALYFDTPEVEAGDGTPAVCSEIPQI
jgi:molecular chaperone DnaK